MKIQYLSVIFCIIVVPISLVLSVYTGNLIKISNREAEYNALLLNSTYDAVRSYQMNVLNNKYASESESRIRDINASTNSFFNSLATGLSSSGYSKDDLNDYVPAILYTLYDGYYVYSCYKNVATVNSGKPEYSTNAQIDTELEYGLKSYIYYTCEYKKNNVYDIIVNYTLDNYLTIYGTYVENGIEKYISASGYYINTEGITSSGDKHYEVVKNNKTTIIEPETLGEYISTTDNYYDINENVNRIYGVKKNDTKYYNYVIYNGTKYYYDDENATDANKNGNQEPIGYQTISEHVANNKAYKNERVNSSSQSINTSFNNSYDGIPIFRLENNLRIYINNGELNSIASYLNVNASALINKTDFKDVNACYYYKNALNFTNNIYGILKQINVQNDTITESYKLKYIAATSGGDTTSETTTHTKTEYATPYIFDFSHKDSKGKSDNDPETEISSFNQHRVDVIISSIESSLVTTIKNFNEYSNSTFEYSFPVLNENDWYTIANNITTVAFLQGLTIGNYKYYTDYAVVANTKSNEYVGRNSIYIQDDYQSNGVTDFQTLYTNNTYEINGNNIEANYHDPRCTKYNTNNGDRKAIGYKNTDYDRNTFIYTEQEYYNNNSVTIYKYNGAENTVSNTTQTENYYQQPGSSGYECIVSNDNDLFSTDDILMENTITSNGVNYTVNSNVRDAYIRTLARVKNAIIMG